MTGDETKGGEVDSVRLDRQGQVILVVRCCVELLVDRLFWRYLVASGVDTSSVGWSSVVALHVCC